MGDTKKKLVYDREPARVGTFQVNSATPFNAEPPGKVLAKEFFTPNEHFFVRNHGPVPEIDSEMYRLSIEGLVENQLSLSLKDLKERFERVTVVATLQVRWFSLGSVLRLIWWTHHNPRNF
jgi:sulfite oxidase